MATPKVEVLPIEKGAIPDSNNVNKHTQRGAGLLENELRRRGAFRSIASAGKDTETPVVYAGNLTLEKAIDAGFTEIVNVHVTGHQLVNVVRDDLAPGSAEAIALGISDNEIGKQSYSPDLDIVAALAAGDNAILSALKNEDKVFGGMLERMGLREETKDAPAQTDRAAELLEKWQVVTGDLWQIGEHRLICGDCTDPAVVARVMDGEKADSMITDPPYGISYGDKNAYLNSVDGGSRIEKPIENDAIIDYRDFFASFLSGLPMADYNTIYIFMSGAELHNLRLAVEDAGLSIPVSSYLVWVKNNHVLGESDYKPKHEFILYCWKGKHKFYGDFTTSVLEYDKPQEAELHPQ